MRSFSYTAKTNLRRLKVSAKDLDERIKTPEDLFKEASNVDVRNIKKAYDTRQRIRHQVPNRKYLGAVLGADAQGFGYEDTTANRRKLSKLLKDKYGDLRLSIKLDDFYNSELDIGDVVDMSGTLDQSNLAVVVELPKSPEDTRYTLVNQFGELEFVSRFNIGFRFPKVFPKAWLKNAVMDEENFIKGTDLNFIGKPRYKVEDDVSRSRMFDSAIARASADCNTELKCYIVPSLLAGIISDFLTTTIKWAWNDLPNMNLKLEVLHNVLQCNESPIQLGFIQLYRSAREVELNSLVKGLMSSDVDKVNGTYKSLLNTLQKQLSVENNFDQISLGRTIIGEAGSRTVLMHKLYTFVLGLRKNNQIFQFDTHDPHPYYVNVVPLNRIVHLNKMVRAFKEDEVNYDMMSVFLTKKMQGQLPDDFDSPDYYEEFVDLLKLYCAASFADNVLESFAVRIIRSLPKYKDVDISRSTAYELLLSLGEISNSEDPTKWWYPAMIPGSGISSKADLEEAYQRSITKDNLAEAVGMNHDSVERTKYDDVVYCIDSKDALEIDDGISIRKADNGAYIVSSFIADPASYIEPNDLISRVAFERGMTLYMPNAAGTRSVSMFPDAFARAVELSSGVDTRVVRFEFAFSPKTKKVSFLKEGGVGFGTVSNQVKTDYDSVNKILDGDKDVLEEVSKKSGVDAEKIYNDLTNLYFVSSSISKSENRDTSHGFSTIKRGIEDISTNSRDEIEVKFQSQNELKSQTLVSEVMIASNKVAGQFFKDHRIPAVYRVQTRLPMSPEVHKWEKSLGSDPSYRDIITFQQYMTRSSLCAYGKRHESLKTNLYATVTSPLRRFCDVINHWQLQSYLVNDKPRFTAKQIAYMVSVLNFKDQLGKQVMKRTRGFYVFKELQQIQEKQGGDSMKFKCIVTRKPTEDGQIEVVLLDYGVRSILRTSWYALSDRSVQIAQRNELLKAVEIGDQIDDATIEDIDLMDGSIVLRSESL